MSKDLDIVKQFSMSTIRETSDRQSHVFVLKTNGELFNLDPSDKSVFQKSAEIKLNDGIHVAWRLFESVAVMESFINEHRVAGETAVKNSLGSSVEIGGAA